jgi:hypothetical protein
MVFEHIEKLQAEYVDKYVVVDNQRPELRRFTGLTGVVKTVNMSGRALVQFDGRNNIGWYDIDIDYLKVVDKPLPKEEPQVPRRATPAKKPPAPGTPAAPEAGVAPDAVPAAPSKEPAVPTASEKNPPVEPKE